MKKIFLLIILSSLFFACSEDIMDDINRDRNNALDMVANNMLPDLILKSAFQTSATDLAWYATVFIEHNAGTWAQSHAADQRNDLEAASTFNNSWNQNYDAMTIAKTILDKTDPVNGNEKTNYYARGVALTLMAYNLAVTTDFWGKVPYSEAFLGAENLNPKYDNQSVLYPQILSMLEEAAENFGKATSGIGTKDFIYSSSIANWQKAAYSLLARYHMQLSNVQGNAAAEAALAAAANGFGSAAEQMQMGGFAIALGALNPWTEFWWSRDHLSVSSTFDAIINERNDPRKAAMYQSGKPIAPIGEADQTQGGYAQSLYTSNWGSNSFPVIVMSYQELKFIIAEAKFRLGHADWMEAFEEAVNASFAAHSTEVGTYFQDEVVPRLTAGNELKEIMTQKYIGFYDREAIQTYNDYRRTGFPEMKNPFNATVGFPHRVSYPVSEVSSNSANVPDINIYTDKLWWAGGAE